MATFEIATKRLPGFDPNLLPKRPGIDYSARADAAWQEIEENLDAIQTEGDRLMEVSLRIQNGETWLRENIESDERMDAYQLLNELRNEAVGIGINIRCLARVVWNNVLTLYACLSHIDARQWMIRHAVGFDNSSPPTIWDDLFPGQEQPGSYPPEKREMWLERKLAYTGWQGIKP